MTQDRRTAFLDALSAEARISAEGITDLDDRLGAIVQTASEVLAWPAEDVGEWMVWVAERLDPEVSVDQALVSLRAEDLCIAWRCAKGDAEAIALFRQRHRPTMEKAIARNSPQEVIEETLQRVFVKLFVGNEERPANVVKYTGRGSLEAWSAVVATREAYTLLSKERRRERVVSDEAGRLFEGVVDASESPELAHLKETYRQQFKEAFQQSLGLLSARDRNILRHQHVDRLDPPQIAALYGVHRATLYRWMEAARKQLLQHTRKVIEQEHRLSGQEFESMFRLIQSQLDVSLSRVLREGDPGTEQK